VTILFRDFASAMPVPAYFLFNVRPRKPAGKFHCGAKKKANKFPGKKVPGGIIPPGTFGKQILLFTPRFTASILKFLA